MKSLIAYTLLALSAAPAWAQGWIEPVRPAPDFGVTKVRTEVAVRVVGRIAHVAVDEWFTNRGGRLGEGDYLYPLPGEAVFSNFSLFQGDEELRGETMDAGQARAIYEEIVRRKRDPALIELAGHGLVRARVFPFNPGETRRITLRYTQVLDRAGDALQFRYAAGGRTATPSMPVEGSTGPRLQVTEAPVTFELVTEDGSAFRDPFSPTHAIESTRRGGELQVRLRHAIAGDFTLFLPFARDVVGLTVVTHRPSSEPGYFMVTLSPDDVRDAVEPRDITAVVDVSGSMSGGKIDQARAALRQLLGTLRPEDRFRLISFSNRVSVYRAEWTDASTVAQRDAEQWIDDLSASGGTNIAGALEEAFRLSTPDERLPVVLFLTDGLPSVGEDNPERIAARAETHRGRARVFVFGVGYDVNTYLLDRLSAAGRGSTEYVEPGQDVEQAVSRLATKIQHPVLTDLALSGPVRLTEVYPRTLPDLFAGEELVIFGRYERTGTGDVAIRGRRNGRPERYTARGAFPDHAAGNDFIPPLWAARKLGVLQQAVRLEGPSPALIDAIRQTALRYGLLSEYTSYLVQEPQMMEVAAERPVGGVPAAAPRPSMSGAGSSGQRAVLSAKADQARREARTVSDLVAMDEEMLRQGHVGQAQHVAGRLFEHRNGVWIDLRHADSLDVVRVEPFSAAYFEILRQLPELAPIFGRWEHVRVAGARVSIELAAGGVSERAAAANLVTRFRGP
ncbi:MAG TPA: VIT domain-containing protein [Gemmatimonadales bacterium]